MAFKRSKIKIDDKVLAKRWTDVDGVNYLYQLPGVVEKWQELKDKRDITNQPIHDRYIKRLETIKKYFEKKYKNIELRIVTDPSAYIDEQTKEEEPEIWNAKKDKKTWSGIYPYQFKMSDIDANPYYKGKPMSDKEIIKKFKFTNIRQIIIDDIKLDLYEDKGEAGDFLNVIIL